MYRLAVTRDFIAQHYLIGGDWGAENQKHSHHYRLQVVLRGTALDRHGYLADIVEIDRALAEVLAQYRDRTLNDLPEFADRNPSLERFARVLHDALDARLGSGQLALSVTLWENERDWASYGSD
jgi:6-pyruvoyltetrahydropterin/6-carboxytetrahydropterin synthase